MEEQDFGRAPAQQTVLERARLPRGRIEAVEAKRGVVPVECVEVRPGALLVVAHEPELALRLLARQMVDAAVENGLLRLSGAGELQRMAGTHVAAGDVGTLQGGEQCGRLDLALGQSRRNRAAVGDELGLPGHPMLGVRHVDPSGIGDKGDVLPDVKGERPGRVVVEVQPAGNPFAVGNVVLALVVDFVSLAAGIGQLTNEARHGRRTQERHVFGPKRNGEPVGTKHQIVEKRLQPAVEEGRKRDISLLSCRRPQLLVDPDIEQEAAGLLLAPEPTNIPELGAVLVGIPENHLESFVDFIVGRIEKSLVARGVDIPQPFRGVHLGWTIDQAHSSAAVQLVLRINLVRLRRNLKRELAGGIGDPVQGRLQPDGCLRDGAGMQEFNHVEMDRHTAKGLQYQLDVARGRHDRRMMDAVIRQPRKGSFGKPRLEQQVVARNPVTNQRAVRILALIQEELVVQRPVDGPLLVARVPRQQRDDGGSAADTGPKNPAQRPP